MASATFTLAWATRAPSASARPTASPPSNRPRPAFRNAACLPTEMCTMRLPRPEVMPVIQPCRSLGYAVNARSRPPWERGRLEAQAEAHAMHLAQVAHVRERVVQIRRRVQRAHREVDPGARRQSFGVIVDVISAADEQEVLVAVLGAHVHALGVVRRVRELERADQ